MRIRTFICDNCKDANICKTGKYKNLFTGQDHPIATDNVFEAFEMFSKTSGEGVKYTNTEYLNIPNKVIMLYKIIANKLNEKRKKDLENKVSK
ncbi:MAG: hypothetical protein GY928_37485 [Colwellia sp.]|nr:hypothetical protein [Colwellia sp.]